MAVMMSMTVSCFCLGASPRECPGASRGGALAMRQPGATPTESNSNAAQTRELLSPSARQHTDVALQHMMNAHASSSAANWCR
eukprot:8615660-Pyramimonas_sp.AAC.1